MLRTLDRYVLRETLGPTLLALVVFTFILQVPPIREVAEGLIAKGVDWRTIGQILVLLLPQALGITIPMAVLVGTLVALGRLSGDRETVAMQACGVSVARLLRPVMAVALLAWAATSWVMIEALPAANQRYREIVYNIVSARAENDVKPRVFFEDFPNLVLYVRDVRPGQAGWSQVFLADTRKQKDPEVFLARRGHLVLDREKRTVDLVLENGAQHRTDPEHPEKYEVQRFGTMVINLDPETVFPRTGLQPGLTEMSIRELRADAALRVAQGQSAHNHIMAIHRKFSIPVACLVFALVALGLGVTSRRDGRQSSFVVGIAVIFVYYIFMYTGESMAKAHWIPAGLAMWIPNIVLGLAGAALVYWRARFADSGGSIRLALPAWWPLRKREPAEASSTAGEAVSPAAAAAVRTAVSPARPRRPGERVVIVIRVPRINLPRLNILDRYVARLYAQMFALAFLGLMGVFYIATFIDLSDKLFKGQTTGGMLLRYFFYATPQYIYFVVPIAALVGALVTVGLLTKSSEIVVMRACGISLYRTAMPLFVFGLIWSGALFFMAESVLASANRRAQEIRHVIRGGSPRTFDVLNRQWIAGGDSRLYHYSFFDPRRLELNGLSIFDFDDRAWRLRSRTFATVARFEEGAWNAQRGWVREFDGNRQVTRYAPYGEVKLDIEPADYFMTEQPDADRMSYRQLKAYVAELQRSGFNAVPYAVELYRKLSFPFVTVIMTLIAVPFAVTTGKHGALYGIGVGIALAIAYWLIFSLFAAIGTAGLLQPALAAWAPNLLFAAAAAYLLLTVRT